MTLEAQSGAGELYDLQNDPDEMINLFDDQRAAPVRNELLEMIDARPDDARPELGTAVGSA